MTDINNIKQTEAIEPFKRSGRLLRASAEAVNALLADADFGAGISRALKTIGEAADVDRIYIFENHVSPKTGALLASQRHEWTRAGITAQIANPSLQNLEYLPVFKRWHETLSCGEQIFGLVRDFPGPERPLLESQDIISILVVPVKIKENLWGFIGFDDCRQERSWTPAEISILTTIAANIGHVLLQKRTEYALQESEFRYRRLVEAITDYIYTVNVENGRTINTFHGPNCISVTGYSSEEYQADQNLWLKMVHPDDRQIVVQQAQRILNGETTQPIEHRIYHKNGTIRWVRNTPVPHFDASGRLVSYDGLIYNITERKQAAAVLVAANKQLSITDEHLVRREQELIKANHEKEILLKEINHRVKNNLQVISSLINLQIHNIADPDAVGLLKECQSRIKTIATMVYEKMYQLGDLARVDIGNYLEGLTDHISRMYLSDPASVTIRVNAKNIYLPIDQAILCALLVNELVANSLKHAFPEHLPTPAIGLLRRSKAPGYEGWTGFAKAGKAGEINVQMVANDSGNYILTVSDNGVGLPSDMDYRNAKSLGMQLVTTFVNQLHGTMELTNNPQASAVAQRAMADKSPEALAAGKRYGDPSCAVGFAEARAGSPRRAGTMFKISFAKSQAEG